MSRRPFGGLVLLPMYPTDDGGGAETTPLAAYLMGFVAIQTVLVVAIAFATRAAWKVSAIGPRLVGAAICGVGFTVLVAQIIPTP